MIPLSLRTQTMLLFALAVPAAASLWLMAVPGVMSVSTYSALTALLIAVAAVTLNSARNAGPTGSLGQLLYETENPALRPSRSRTTDHA